MIYSGSCHCGAIAFEVEADITQAMDCNCSMCRRRGGLLAFVPRENFRLQTPQSAVSTYQFNKHVIQHHFCATCGIAPYAEGESKTGAMTAVNVRCLPDVDLETLTITKVDGRSF
ncbi:GFA family protein [Rhizobium sp. LjRoot98]|uniref:GFA family protein n=1 Tax=unclassified Rhizobium TaxID=2613769 RepID=UPI0007138C1A|nr:MULTISPECIES: GFA family protein [unclassified Rhizobium]KQV32003.1 aldehyde-activating protein [Rhizobium sp. Root1204]KQY05140.1 aldehyde-activating protein [Rhizobium sp. Root1334]KRC02151.1 aldehyde-activating protein [Rhizobium sp. Root73]